jgi:(heptosyl)LPS beta-1,4-glucosyltransferase
MNNITGIIVAKGKPKYIHESIDSLSKLCNEIVIADIGLETKINSNQNIIIRKIYKATPYVELIREELKVSAKNEYIFFLDPDEILPESLIKIIKTTYLSYDYIRIPRKNIIFGKWIQNSRWWPDYQIRLFKKNAVQWPKLIHHQPITQGKSFTVEQKEEYAILHHNYENLDEYMEKAIRYAKSEAQEYINSNSSLLFSETINKSISEFIGRFFEGKGYRDGSRGFVLAFLQMIYYFFVYFYYWEKKQYFEADEKTLITASETFFKKGLYETNHWIMKKHKESFFLLAKRKIINMLIKKPINL